LVLKSSEKIQIFEKVGKNSDKTAEEKLVFCTFSDFLGPKEEGRVDIPRNMKKVIITAP
jgi:hypothetical protein